MRETSVLAMTHHGPSCMGTGCVESVDVRPRRTRAVSSVIIGVSCHRAHACNVQKGVYKSTMMEDYHKVSHHFILAPGLSSFAYVPTFSRFRFPVSILQSPVSILPFPFPVEEPRDILEKNHSGYTKLERRRNRCCRNVKNAHHECCRGKKSWSPCRWAGIVAACGCTISVSLLAMSRIWI